MFWMLKKKTAAPGKYEVAATKLTNFRHPVRKCPFMYPLVQNDSNGLPNHTFYDCMRQNCQIWDGFNCSLHHDGRKPTSED